MSAESAPRAPQAGQTRSPLASNQRAIVSLTRMHRVSIRELSRRMQITRKRTRQIRRGLAHFVESSEHNVPVPFTFDHPGFARDWIEHIIGTDLGPYSDVEFLLSRKT